MRYIAYKKADDSVVNLPNGFITEHFETDQPTLEGYEVVTLEVFNTLFQNNVRLVRESEAAQGIMTPNTVPVMVAPAINAKAEPVVPVTSNNQSSNGQPTTDQAVLFQQFLAWMASQQNPNNT